MVKELTAEQVRLSYSTDFLSCASTADLKAFEGIIGQDRALSALNFGLNIQKPGFNIFVSGLAGTGKTTVIKGFLESLAGKKPVPPDWCYVYNFKDSYSPKALQVPPGTGLTLQKDMKKLVETVRRALKQAFTSKEYSARHSEIVEVLSRKRESAFEAFSARAKSKGLLLKASQVGLILIPATGDQPMSDEDFAKLTPEQRDELAKRRDELTRELKDMLLELQLEEGTVEKQAEEFNRQTAEFSISLIFDELKKKYQKESQIVSYLEDVAKDIVDNFAQLIVEPKSNSHDPTSILQEIGNKQALTRYEINVLVDNSEAKGAPVILELNPTFNNLFGRVEKEAQFGALITDFTMIKAGSLHCANGGYLVMRIEDLLTSFQSWETLKRILRDGKLMIEDIGERMGFIVTRTLRPEPIPLNIKIVLIGEPMFYYALMQFDREFNELFKVKADFDSVMDRTDNYLKDYAAVICKICITEGSRHLRSDALSKVLEHSSRLAGDQAKLSTLFADIADIIREANFWAEQDGAELIEAVHIVKAIDQKFYRSNLIQQHITEAINKGIYMIDTTSEVVGQVNGLAVIGLGDIVFGRPSRITASLGMGREGVVDIEREANLGGKLHTKGVMILNGHIMEKFASNAPLSLSARLVFEQSYDEVDGDSASSTELYVLLSRLAEAPIKQGIAVTGSVNQKGEVQAIGGVNEKIEGFFEICRLKGLDGKQGVMIPASNAMHLMLKDEVVDAIKNGKFHIYPVNTIDEGIEILTGINAGKLISSGVFEPGSINDRVQKRLIRMTETMRDYFKTEDKVKTRRLEPASPKPKPPKKL